MHLLTLICHLYVRTYVRVPVRSDIYEKVTEAAASWVQDRSFSSWVQDRSFVGE